MFGSIYWGEVKKAFRLKTVIVMAIIAVLVVAITAAVFVSMNKLLEDFGEDVTVTEPGVLVEGSGTDKYTEESVLAELESLRIMKEELLKEREKQGYAYYRDNDYIYTIDCNIAAREYILENKLYDMPLAIYENSGVFGILGGKMSADNFIVYVMQTMFTLVMIYGAIVAGSIFADEFKRGTIKLLLLRPISRNELTTAKLLAALTHVLGAYIFAFLVSVIAGYIAFPVENIDTIFMFNGGAVSVADNSAQIGISFALGLVPVVAYTIVAFAVGAMSRNKVLAIVTPILIIDIVFLIFRLAGLGRFFITDACNWMKFVGINDTLIGGSNFFISLAVTAVYMAGLLAGSYLMIDKRDVV